MGNQTVADFLKSRALYAFIQIKTCNSYRKTHILPKKNFITSYDRHCIYMHMYTYSIYSNLLVLGKCSYRFISHMNNVLRLVNLFVIIDSPVIEPSQAT